MNQLHKVRLWHSCADVFQEWMVPELLHCVSFSGWLAPDVIPLTL